MFSGIRQGNLFYVLDKSNLSLRIGEVESVSNPTDKFGHSAYPQNPFAQADTHVDVVVRFGDESEKYEQLPSGMSVSRKNNLIVSDNREAMNLEVEAMLRSSHAVLDSMPYHEKVLASCDAMLRELNPQFAKEKEQEEKIGQLEQRMGHIDGKLERVLELLSDTVNTNKSKKQKED